VIDVNQYTLPSQEIPYGYCHCGCGQKTKPAKMTNRKRGAIAGMPQRFVASHSNGPKSLRNTVSDFWDHVQAGAPDECWLWTGMTERFGYGVIRIAGVRKKAHRLSWEIHFGEIPNGLLVCHQCDVPACVNPHHLFLGTIQDNNADRVAKGRDNHPGMQGDAHPMAKLTEDDVRSIRKRATKRGDRKILAEEYGVSIATIDLVVTGKTWKHVR
jgi:hypothetical protein